VKSQRGECFGGRILRRATNFSYKERGRSLEGAGTRQVLGVLKTIITRLLCPSESLSLSCVT
jgi:hypothetical protein